MISLLALAGGHMWWIHHRVADEVLRGREDAAQWRGALLGASWIMVLALLVNAQGFAKMTLMVQTVGTEGRETWLELLGWYVSVVGGTASLMWLVVRALREPVVLREPTPAMGASRVMVVVAEKLLPRFWWAALGLGAVFGYAAGSGPILLLAADLTLFWAVGRISLIVHRRRLQRERDGE